MRTKINDWFCVAVVLIAALYFAWHLLRFLNG